jgi:hypothetical protein
MYQGGSQDSSGLFDGHVVADAVLRDLTSDNELVVLALNETGCYDTGMQAIVDYIDSVAPADTPRIIVGDFNASDSVTDPPLSASGSTSGMLYHGAGIRLIRDANGYRDMFRRVNPSGRNYTATLNKTHTSLWDQQVSLGMSPGDGYKRIDYAFSKHIPDSDIVSATTFGGPNGGSGSCIASDHLGVKVGVTVH